MWLATEKVKVKTSDGISKCYSEYSLIAAKQFLTDVKIEESGILCSIRKGYKPQGGLS